MKNHESLFALLLLVSPLLSACGSEGRADTSWTGSIDTLTSGQIVVRNTADPVWREGSAWRVEEEARIGSPDGTGPDVFGRISSLEVDRGGRIWVMESQAQELRVFGPAGEHVRTVGRRGQGPGEFAQVAKVELGPDGNLWAMDPQNNRVSVFDTAGAYLEAKHAAGGFMIFPWPGRFDDAGHYYAPVPLPGDGFRVGMVRHDREMNPLDTLETPEDPVERAFFEHRSERGAMMAGVPFSGGLDWKVSPSGTIWALVTDQYRLFELGADGDTLRTITRAFTPLPVTEEDRARAREDMKWFTDQGGRADFSKIPATKPAARNLHFDDEGNVWVDVVTATEDESSVFDVFDREGRYLGQVRMPFRLSTSPRPIFRDGLLYGTVTDDLDVPYVVRARIVKP